VIAVLTPIYMARLATERERAGLDTEAEAEAEAVTTGGQSVCVCFNYLLPGVYHYQSMLLVRTLFIIRLTFGEKRWRGVEFHPSASVNVTQC